MQWKVFQPMAGGWKWIGFKTSSNPSHSVSVQFIPHIQTMTAPRVHTGYTHALCARIAVERDVAEDTQRITESLRLETWRQIRSLQSAKAFNAYWHCSNAPDLLGTPRIPGCPTAESGAAEKRLPDGPIHAPYVPCDPDRCHSLGSLGDLAGPLPGAWQESQSCL